MNTLAQNQKVIKGLSIAAIVISGLTIIVSLVAIYFASASLAYVNELIDTYSGMGYGHHSYYNYYYYDPEELAAVSLGVTALFGLSILALISSGFQLFTAIYTFIKHQDTSKAKALFVLTIIAAVASLIVGGIVNLVLFVIMAVYLNKIRKGTSAPAYTVPTPAAATPVAPAAAAPAPAATATPAPATASPAAEPVVTPAADTTATPEATTSASETPAASATDASAASSASESSTSTPVPPAPPAPGAQPIAAPAPTSAAPTDTPAPSESTSAESTTPAVSEETMQEVEQELNAELDVAIAEETAEVAAAEALGDAVADRAIDQAVNGAKAAETDAVEEIISTEAINEVTNPNKQEE